MEALAEQQVAPRVELLAEQHLEARHPAELVAAVIQETEAHLLILQDWFQLSKVKMELY